MSRPGLELGVFTKIIFKLTIDISMRKIILEVEYVVKRMIYQLLKFFKSLAFGHPVTHVQKLQISLLMLKTDFCPSPLHWGQNFTS